MTIYYETQERAFAPGIADGWPKVIPAPHTRNGRLVRLDRDIDAEDVALKTRLKKAEKILTALTKTQEWHCDDYEAGRNCGCLMCRIAPMLKSYWVKTKVKVVKLKRCKKCGGTSDDPCHPFTGHDFGGG